MGGRGVGRGGGSGRSSGRFVKDDNSQVTISTDNLTATENVVKALGEENVANISDYVNGAIKTVTGIDDYVQLNMIAGATGSAYAWMDGTGTIGINDKLFKKNIETIRESYKDDVQAGFHPKNTDFNDIAVHEAGHYLDWKLTQALGDQIPATDRVSTPIVRQALQNLKKRGDQRNFFLIQNSLSGYGADFYDNHTGNNFVETYAEAIADYGKNKGNANPLSIEIVRLTREYLNRVR